MFQPQYSPTPSFVVSPSSTTAPGKPLTDLLLEHQPYLLELATRAPFLVAAGTGNLSKALLSRWLSQDRLYAQAYIGFIGALISRVDLPYAYIEDKQSSLRWRIVNMLSSCLENIHRELKFFEDVAKRYDLMLDYPPRPDVYFTADNAAKQYIELFRAFWTDPTMTLLEGLVILWATEYCYLDAWRYARSHLNSGRRDDLDGGALRNEFIPNWTSDEFEKFVNEIALCTNLLAEREDADGSKTETLKAVWAHVLAIERKFWPEM
jgi:thiaminase